MQQLHKLDHLHSLHKGQQCSYKVINHDFSLYLKGQGSLYFPFFITQIRSEDIQINTRIPVPAPSHLRQFIDYLFNLPVSCINKSTLTHVLSNTAKPNKHVLIIRSKYYMVFILNFYSVLPY